MVLTRSSSKKKSKKTMMKVEKSIKPALDIDLNKDIQYRYNFF